MPEFKYFLYLSNISNLESIMFIYRWDGGVGLYFSRPMLSAKTIREAIAGNVKTINLILLAADNDGWHISDFSSLQQLQDSIKGPQLLCRLVTRSLSSHIN